MNKVFRSFFSTGGNSKEKYKKVALEMMDEDDDEFDDEETGEEDDFRERTAWQSKYDAKTCFGCGNSFNVVTNRHHHCRQCGRVVCGACSEHKDRVKGYSKPQRTCDECHEKLANEINVAKVLFLLCPCLKMVKREIKKARTSQLLYDGAIFVKKRDLKSVSKAVFSGLFSSLASSTNKEEEKESSLATTRVRVKLRNDGLVLVVKPIGSNADEDDTEIYLHDVSKIQAKGQRGLILLSGTSSILFEGDLTDKSTRDDWLKALSLAVKSAAEKPPPPRTQSTTSRVTSAARRAKKEIELQGRKRDAERKKQDYLSKVGGGLKYTALAMADRASTSSNAV
mmetsp:Transcript_11237/g.15441  ORF Transcript_11237/g.15441 Transcript_11237/m.15441 type:complete len:339 (+) Transcript_11237:233-1249(+)|eukprot:CAMPEP_0197301566 /NCGR_PEP_ID=MMETSP0890-20130614/50483_1 /TAXON_ID=44058 ORGANISM="Aureoumbra lagunensis, Strain CCMP1510" /NCGR_SAMPLE_ID=MMETSP0890 /ASSEMBLY_ACC=CAM_ASM_000533 /LENGTH=338 /DNA_ID=CAMNT_0042780909 /DNA_START=2771 /DNA_END=3787 /DNA_ORIENTATION=-